MKLLLVEDNLGDAEFLSAALRRQRVSDLELTHVSSIAEAKAALTDGQFDVILLDLHLPDASGVECLDTIQRVNAATPIVVLSGQDDEDFAISVLNRGAQDYLVKWEGKGRTILRSIRYAIERKRSELRLNYLAQYDPLTEVPNRQYFHHQLERATARARREASQVALFFLDLDQFKVINDTLGHDAGDNLLKEMADRLRNSVRSGDVIARLGGDEFAILLEDLNGVLDAEAVARGILDVIAKPFHVNGRQIAVTTSIGITIYPNDNSDTQTLLKNADIAMYQAKEKGRNNFKFFTERMHAELMMYHQLEHDIKQALHQELFELVYQPKVHMLDRRLEGLEALLRWSDDERGQVPPGEFIPVAEESGHIVPLGYWVLGEVCRAINRWKSQGLPVVPVSINVSARQFAQADFHRRVGGILRQHRIEPGEIEFEMTEGLLMDDTEAAQACLQRLKSLGLRISIDDFGTGHSCLNYLRRFPVDVLKIDRSFVQDIGSCDDSSVIVEAIIGLAKSLQLETVAEGVETREQLEFLLDRGCHVAQGFLFGRPIRFEEVLPLLQDLTDDVAAFRTGQIPVASGG